MVHEQLRQLLLEHDCVTLPGLGALLAEPVPARIHPVRHTLSPPARRVVFSDRLRHDDGLLTDAVRRALPTAESFLAPVCITTFAGELRAALRQHRAAELRSLGTLRQPTDGSSIRFEALEPGYLPLADSFGLPELVSRPIALTERNRATRYVPAPSATDPRAQTAFPVRLRRLVGESTEPLYRLATAAIVVLSLTATYFAFRLSPLADRYQVATPVAEQTIPQRAAVGAAQDQTTSSTSAAPVTIPAESVSDAPLGTYAPVAGAVLLAKPAASKSTATVASPASAAKAEAAGPATPVAAVTIIRSAPTNRYYLIWNAFATKAKAERGRSELVKLTPADAAHVPTVLSPPRGSALFRVDHSVPAATIALPRPPPPSLIRPV